MCRFGLAICCFVFVSPAFAAELSADGEARLALGQCYSGCMAEYREAKTVWVQSLERFNSLAISNDFHSLPTSSRDDTYALELGNLCAIAQGVVRVLEGCYLGCRDMEVAYDYNTSSARSRFTWIYNYEKNTLTDAGLWVSYNRSPAFGTDEFNAACAVFWGEDTETSSSVNRFLSSVPDADE